MKRSVTPTARAPGVQGRQSPGETSPTTPVNSGPRSPGGMLHDRCWTARRPTLTAARSAALHSAPRLRRPGRAALPFRFREPRRRDRPSGCRHARAPARRHGRRRCLRFAPRSCDGSRRGPKDLKARSPELRPAYLRLTYLGLPALPAARSHPGGHTRVSPHPPYIGPALALSSARFLLLSGNRPLSSVTCKGFSMLPCFKI